MSLVSCQRLASASLAPQNAEPDSAQISPSGVRAHRQCVLWRIAMSCIAAHRSRKYSAIKAWPYCVLVSNVHLCEQSGNRCGFLLIIGWRSGICCRVLISPQDGFVVTFQAAQCQCRVPRALLRDELQLQSLGDAPKLLARPSFLTSPAPVACLVSAWILHGTVILHSPAAGHRMHISYARPSFLLELRCPQRGGGPPLRLSHVGEKPPAAKCFAPASPVGTV